MMTIENIICEVPKENGDFIVFRTNNGKSLGGYCIAKDLELQNLLISVRAETSFYKGGGWCVPIGSVVKIFRENKIIYSKNGNGS